MRRAVLKSRIAAFRALRSRPTFGPGFPPISAARGTSPLIQCLGKLEWPLPPVCLREPAEPPMHADWLLVAYAGLSSGGGPPMTAFGWESPGAPPHSAGAAAAEVPEAEQLRLRDWSRVRLQQAALLAVPLRCGASATREASDPNSRLGRSSSLSWGPSAPPSHVPSTGLLSPLVSQCPIFFLSNTELP